MESLLFSFKNLFLFFFSVEKIKLAITTEIKAWIVAYGKSTNLKYKTSLNDILKFIDIYIKRFNRPIEDLDDVRYAMATLRQLRNEEIKTDMDIEPIEVVIFEVLPNFLDGFPFRLINF